MPKAGNTTPKVEARRRAGVLLGLVLLATCARADTAEIHLGLRRLSVEVAATPESRARGLMHRTALPEHQGMLFVFPVPARQCMWMKDTLIPLSVAFMDARGRIINIADMSPRNLRIHCSAAPARYALEMNQGWFQRNTIQVGDLATGMERLSAW
jgi:uncharacterized membrane protein (UPF0127 family)